jgi:GNAT superfamily N-acetyltransferase
MDLRAYRSGDVEAMFRLDEVCFPEPYRFDRITMREFAEARSAIVAIVEDKAKREMAGFLILHIEKARLERREVEPCGYIVTIDVAPALRRTGIATEMMSYVERKARAAGVNSVALHVAIDNGVRWRSTNGTGTAVLVWPRTSIAKPEWMRWCSQSPSRFARPWRILRPIHSRSGMLKLRRRNHYPRSSSEIGWIYFADGI